MAATTGNDWPDCFGSYGTGECPMSDECIWVRECYLCALVYGVKDEEDEESDD